MNSFFEQFARKTSEVVGSVRTFTLAVVVLIIWTILGPLMHFSDTWQLIITTISSIVTYLIVFLIQYAQNKDTKAIHLKLDELIKVHSRARNEFVNIEEEPEKVIDTKIKSFEKFIQNKKR